MITEEKFKRNLKKDLDSVTADTFDWEYTTIKLIDEELKFIQNLPTTHSMPILLESLSEFITDIVKGYMHMYHTRLRLTGISLQLLKSIPNTK